MLQVAETYTIVCSNQLKSVGGTVTLELAVICQIFFFIFEVASVLWNVLFRSYAVISTCGSM